jgi:hypothetical protein
LAGESKNILDAGSVFNFSNILKVGNYEKTITYEIKKVQRQNTIEPALLIRVLAAAIQCALVINNH